MGSGGKGMAKVVITIEDDENENDIRIGIESDPPFPMKEGALLSNAQCEGLQFLEWITSEKNRG